MGYNPEGHDHSTATHEDSPAIMGNLRFIRRRKDGTYMDNVDFGRSIQTDRHEAKTGTHRFRDQGDGSLDC